jgi:DNA-binding NarL/FixJ family response regulator
MWAEGNSPQRNGEPLKTLRILIADDHDLMRRGVKALLESHEGWEVCGEAKTGREAVAKAEQLRPDILVLDIGMPDLNGVEAARRKKGIGEYGDPYSVLALLRSFGTSKRGCRGSRIYD